MARIERFEDIKAWQKGRELCKLVYTCSLAPEFSRDRGLRDQIRRAAVSIVSNIAEGFESQNDRTFIRYLYIARASSGEVRAQTYVALDQGYINQEEFKSIYEASCTTSRMITGFITYLNRSPAP